MSDSLISPMRTAILNDRKGGPERRLRVLHGPDHSDAGASEMAPPKKSRTSPSHKVCVRCRTDKPSSQFYGSNAMADGLRSWCKPCSLEVKQARADYGRDPHPEIFPAGLKRCKACGEIKPISDFGRDKRVASGKNCRCRRCCVAYTKALYRKYRGKQTEAYRKYMYGLSPSQFAAMRAAQKDCCVICAKPFPNPTSTHVDHDHATGRVRALLCNRCNHGLGMFADDDSLLVVAAEYLRHHKAEPESV